MRVYYFYLSLHMGTNKHVMTLLLYPKDMADNNEDGGVDDEPYLDDGTSDFLELLGFDCEVEGEFTCFTDKSVDEMKQVLIESDRFELNQEYWNECEKAFGP